MFRAVCSGLLHRGGGDARDGLAVLLDRLGQVADDEDLGMAGDGQVGLDPDPARAVERDAQRPRQRRGGDARRPEHRPRLDPLGADADPLGVDRRDRSCRSGPRRRALRAAAGPSPRAPGRRPGRTRGEPSSRITRACGRVDVAEVLGQGVPGDLDQRHPPARRPSARRRRSRTSARPRRRAGSALALGGLEREQDPAADLQGVADALQARGDRRPLVVAEVRVRRAGGHDQVVVRHRAAVGQDDRFASEVDRPSTSASRTSAFFWPRRIRRIGEAMSLGFSAAVATW